MVFYYRLYFAIGSFVIGAGLLWIAWNRGRVVLARGEGRWFWQRWFSGSHRMLNGDIQIWDITSKVCLGFLCLFNGSTAAYSLITNQPAGTVEWVFYALAAIFSITIIVVAITAGKSHKAAKRVLALSDPLELALQIAKLQERVLFLTERALEKDEEEIAILQGAVNTLTEIHNAFESAKATE